MLLSLLNGQHAHFQGHVGSAVQGDDHLIINLMDVFKHVVIGKHIDSGLIVQQQPGRRDGESTSLGHDKKVQCYEVCTLSSTTQTLVPLATIIPLSIAASVLMSALSCIVPWLATVEADHLTASCEGDAVSAQHSSVACVGLTPLQNVVGFVKSRQVHIVTIKVAVVKVSKIRLVVGIHAVNEQYCQTHFSTGCAIGVIWDHLTIRTNVAIPNCDVIDKFLVGDTYADFVEHLHLSEEQLVIVLQ